MSKTKKKTDTKTNTKKKTQAQIKKERLANLKKAREAKAKKNNTKKNTQNKNNTKPTTNSTNTTTKKTQAQIKKERLANLKKAREAKAKKNNTKKNTQKKTGNKPRTNSTKTTTKKSQAQIKKERLANLKKAREAKAKKENVRKKRLELEKEQNKNKQNTKKTNTKTNNTAKNAKDIYEIFHLFESDKKFTIKDLALWKKNEKVEYVGELKCIQYSSDKYDHHRDSWEHTVKVKGFVYEYEGNYFINAQIKITPRGLEDDSSINIAKLPKKNLPELNIKDVAVLGNKIALKVKGNDGITYWIKPKNKNVAKDSLLLAFRKDRWLIMYGSDFVYDNNNASYLKELL